MPTSIKDMTAWELTAINSTNQLATVTIVLTKQMHEFIYCF